MPVRSYQVRLSIPPIGEISGTWEPDDSEVNAAWEMYVELVTRAAVVPLPAGEGLLREALTSLYDLFGITREILRRYGPKVAKPKTEGDISFGKLAVFILNGALRPLLTTWHPRLQAYESTRSPDEPNSEHERRWEYADELRRELESTRRVLRTFAAYLAKVSDVPDLIEG